MNKYQVSQYKDEFGTDTIEASSYAEAAELWCYVHDEGEDDMTLFVRLRDDEIPRKFYCYPDRTWTADEEYD